MAKTPKPKAETVGNVTTLPVKARGPGLTPGEGHNAEKEATEAKKEREKREDDMLVAHVAKIRQSKPGVATAKITYDAVVKKHNDLYRDAKNAAGFTRKEIDGYIERLEAKNRDDAVMEARRARHSRALGLAAADQMDLLDQLPTEAKDQEQWKAEGVTAGVRGEKASPPKECPPRMVDHWMQGWHDGQARLAQGMKTFAKAPKGPAAPPSKAETVAKVEAVKEQVKADLAEDAATVETADTEVTG